jgi:Uma2 family endonuclease
MLTNSLNNIIDLIPKNLHPDTFYLINNVSWLEYETLLDQLGDSLKFKLKYWDGVLELMSPSRNHEIIKSRIGDLLSIYFLEKNIWYCPTGSTTFKSKTKQAGIEPDESYCLVNDKDFPDLAIEVNISSGGLDKLAVYQALGVREVWFWENNDIFIYHLVNNVQNENDLIHGYQLVNQSVILPGLNLDLLRECLSMNDTLDSIKNFRKLC